MSALKLRTFFFTWLMIQSFMENMTFSTFQKTDSIKRSSAEVFTLVPGACTTFPFRICTFSRFQLNPNEMCQFWLMFYSLWFCSSASLTARLLFTNYSCLIQYEAFTPVFSSCVSGPVLYLSELHGQCWSPVHCSSAGEFRHHHQLWICLSFHFFLDPKSQVHCELAMNSSGYPDTGNPVGYQTSVCISSCTANVFYTKWPSVSNDCSFIIIIFWLCGVQIALCCQWVPVSLSSVRWRHIRNCGRSLWQTWQASTFGKGTDIKRFESCCFI